MNQVTQHSEYWLKQRFKRQVKALTGIAWPATLSRIGVIFLSTVDTFMVGHYSTTELAYLNLGSGTIVMVALVTTIGLLIGTLIKTADAYGREDFEGAGNVWIRSFPYAVGVGLLCLLICLPGEWMFLKAGLSEDLSRQGGLVLLVLGLGLPGNIIYIHSMFFLEGIERPKVGMYMMLGANVLNLILNYGLIYGSWGFPELGAVGSAWASTIGRLVLAVCIVYYVLHAKVLAKYKLALKWHPQWTTWAHQRKLGYAASISLFAEVTAFASLSIFAGWLGTLELAAWGIVMNVMTLGFMVASGMGVAASVRVGIAVAREDYPDAGLAGLTAVLLSAVGLSAVGVVLFFYNEGITAYYTSDTAVVALTAPLIIFTAFVLLFDGEQAVLASALRGMGESWFPMYIQIAAYWVVMLPVSYFVTINMGRGIIGLLEAVLYAAIVSCFFQGWRFYHLVKKGLPQP